MHRVALLVASLVLFAALARAEGNATPTPSCVDDGRGTRVCSQLDVSALGVPGRSTIWRVWLEGGGNPIQIRLHDYSPQVVRVRGGDDQIVHMGCRRHREVRRRVTAIAAGSPRLQARAFSPSVTQEAAEIAAGLAPRLAQIEADFVRRSAELPVGDKVAATALVDRTEGELLEALSYQELAALRDYVRAQLGRARAAGETASSPGAARARQRPQRLVYVILLSQEPLSPGATANGKSMLDGVLRCIHDLREMVESNHLLASLCFTSDVPSARFKMRPQSLNQWLADKLTPGEYREVYRGLYIYSAQKLFHRIQCLDPQRDACPPINLVDDSDPIFHCDFASGVCVRKSGSLPAGTCHGQS